MKYRNERIAPAAGLRLRPRDAAKSASSCLTTAIGTASRSSREMDRAIGHAALPRRSAFSAGCLYYGQQWWMGRTLSGDKDVKWIAAQGPAASASSYHPRTRPCDGGRLRGFYAAPGKAAPRSTSLANSIIPSVRDNNTR
jgi:hypothetical protein